jgi:hypothetical protein
MCISNSNLSLLIVFRNIVCTLEPESALVAVSLENQVGLGAQASQFQVALAGLVDHPHLHQVVLLRQAALLPSFLAALAHQHQVVLVVLLVLLVLPTLLPPRLLALVVLAALVALAVLAALVAQQALDRVPCDAELVQVMVLVPCDAELVQVMVMVPCDAELVQEAVAHDDAAATDFRRCHKKARSPWNIMDQSTIPKPQNLCSLNIRLCNLRHLHHFFCVGMGSDSELDAAVGLAARRRDCKKMGTFPE